jgi:hypothetical protein
MFTVIEQIYTGSGFYLPNRDKTVGIYEAEVTAEDAAYRAALAYKPELPEYPDEYAVYWVFNTETDSWVSDWDSPSCKAVHKAIHG